MNSAFRALCEAERERLELPALAVGTLVEGSDETIALGCEPGTRFRIASITKPLVATLVTSVLDLDEPTGVWPDDVRVCHLLSHTSGFDCELGDRDYSRFGQGDEALAACIAELPSVRRFFGVDEVWSYANTGYWLAAWLAAQRADASFEDALAEQVLRPAGLEATSFGEPDVQGHGDGIPPAPYPRARRPSGGLASTVPDLLRFGAAHLADPRAARLRVPAGRPVGGVYGLGLFGERVAGVEVWGHPGSYGGFETTFRTIPSHGAVLVVLSNSQRGAAAIRRIEDAFFAAVLGEGRRVPDTVELPPDALEAFAGTYATLDGPVAVEREGGGLRVALPDGASVLARPIGERTFELVAGDLAGFRFDFPRAGYVRVGSRVAERVA